MCNLNTTNRCTNICTFKHIRMQNSVCKSFKAQIRKRSKVLQYMKERLLFPVFATFLRVVKLTFKFCLLQILQFYNLWSNYQNIICIQIFILANFGFKIEERGEGGAGDLKKAQTKFKKSGSLHCLCKLVFQNVHYIFVSENIVQGYPKIMRHQRRL